MASIAITHDDCTVWTITKNGVRRLSGEEVWIDFGTPPGIVAISGGQGSDDLYAVQINEEGTFLIRRERYFVQSLPGTGIPGLTELSVGKDRTLCALISQNNQLLPYVFADGEWTYFGAPVCTAISVVDQDLMWFVSSHGEVGHARPIGRGWDILNGISNATWISAADDGTVLVTTPEGVFQLTSQDPATWTLFAPLPPNAFLEAGVIVECGSKDYVYATDIQTLWKWGGTEWNIVETNKQPFWRISVASDGSVVGSTPNGVARTTSFGWEILPDLAIGPVTSTDVDHIWSFNLFSLGQVTYWPGTFWELYGNSPVTVLSAGSNGEIWGIDLQPNALQSNVSSGTVFRRDPATRNWMEMPGPMNWVSVGSASFIAALDPNHQVRLWDAEVNDWGPAIESPEDELLSYVGIGDDGALMATGRFTYVFLGGRWVQSLDYGIRELQVADEGHACGFSDGVWVGGAFVGVGVMYGKVKPL